MKTLLLDPFLAVEPAEPRGWYVICSPGSLAALLADLAGEKARDCTICIRGLESTEPPRSMVAIPLTDALDKALAGLTDALISMRYETGQVQLRLDLGVMEEML